MNVLEASAGLPEALRVALVNAYRQGAPIVDALDRRMPPQKALMVGLALQQQTREMMEDAIGSFANTERSLGDLWGEVIIGSGPHAATYAAMRTRMGASKPLVLERRGRFGGTFAMTRQQSFYLNSRNRPGPFGNVGSRDALNVIPGAPMQPSDLSGAEYQANADLGLITRCTLALNAKLRRAEVESVMRQGNSWVIETNRGQLRAQRVVVATGIGRPKQLDVAFDNKQVFSYEQFMQRFEQPFPLRELGRVAVVGDGDSARTVVEALAGYGPQLNGSVASLDYITQIDWYGVGTAMNKARWLECNRTRYKPLAALFPPASNARVRPLEPAKIVFRTQDSICINGNYYETVIVCVGFEGLWQEMIGFEGEAPGRIRTESEIDDNRLSLALGSEDRSLIVIGPAADIPYSRTIDPEPTRSDENRVALFRLIPRTAALAMQLALV